MRQVRIPDEVHDGLTAVADLHGQPVDDLVRDALIDLLADRYHAVHAACARAAATPSAAHDLPVPATRTAAARSTAPLLPQGPDIKPGGRRQRPDLNDAAPTPAVGGQTSGHEEMMP